MSEFDMGMGMDLGTAEGSDYQADADNLVMNLDGVDENKSGFEALPVGTYDCIVENTDYGLSANGGNPMITWQFKVVDPSYNNRLLFFHTVLNKDLGIANLKKILVRVCPDVNLSSFNPKVFSDNGTAIGLPCQVKVKIRPYKGEKRNQVVEVLPPKAAGSFIDGPGL